MLQQYFISIDARLRSRNSTVSVKVETAECLVARSLTLASMCFLFTLVLDFNTVLCSSTALSLRSYVHSIVWSIYTFVTSVR